MSGRREIRAANRRGRPNRLATKAVELAALALPTGDVRRRWERELIAEMYGLSGRRQAGYAAMTLATAWSLRRSIAGTGRGGTMTITKPRKPLLCKLNLKHRWVRESAPDGDLRYWRCVRCDKERFSNGPDTIGAAAANGGVM